MKLTIALILMTTALGASSAGFAAGKDLWMAPDVSPVSRIVPGAALTLIDDDGDEGESDWSWSPSDDDDDDDDDDEEEDCTVVDDDVDECASPAAPNAARVGTAPPPQNGLFTGGTALVVTSN